MNEVAIALTLLRQTLESFHEAEWIEVHRKATTSNRFPVSDEKDASPFYDVVLFASFSVDKENTITITLLEAPDNSKIVFTLPLSALPAVTPVKLLSKRIESVLSTSNLTAAHKLSALALAGIGTTGDTK